MKNKGFTLIELLAVIVILAIIALIATPIILGIINNASLQSKERTSELIGDAVVNAYTSYALKNPAANTSSYCEYMRTEFTMDNASVKSCESDIAIVKSGNDEYQVKYENGKAYITLEGSDKVSEVVIDPNNNQGGSTLNKLNEIKNATILDKYSDDSEITWADLKEALTTLKGEELNAMVGKEKTVDMGSLGIHKVRIANVSSPADFCNNPDNSETACGIVLEFSDVITHYNMNSTSKSTGGYSTSSMHSYLSNDIYNALPLELQSIIIETKVVSSYGYNDANGTGKDGNWISNDKLYLLSIHEVWENGSTNKITAVDSAYNLTRQLDYYKKLGTTTDNELGVKKQYNESGEGWWLRTAGTSNPNYFYFVGISGDWSGAGGSAPIGVSPAFRISK